MSVAGGRRSTMTSRGWVLLAAWCGLLALGVNLISVGFTWADPADYVAQLERFGREVIAVLREDAQTTGS